MPRKTASSLTYGVLLLDGQRYAVLPERTLAELAERAGVAATPAGADPTPGDVTAVSLDRARLARRLAQRRQRVGLTQAVLAQRAGIRVETLNRIERGHTNPDFATVRKLVEAINAAEAALSGIAPTATEGESHVTRRTRTHRVPSGR